MVCLQFEDGGEVVGVEAGAHDHPVPPAQPVQPRLEPVLLPALQYYLAIVSLLSNASPDPHAVVEQHLPAVRQPHHVHPLLLVECHLLLLGGQGRLNIIDNS